MKKHQSIAATLLLALGMLAGPALGQEEGADRRGRRARRSRGRGRMAQVIKSLNLVEAQQEPVKQKLKAHRDAVQNYQKENGEDLRAARKAMQEARKSGDKEAIAAARKAMKGHQDALKELRKDLETQLADVLTPEQLAKFKAGGRGAAGPGARFARALGRVGLTPEQIAKIRKDILTPAQRKKLAQALSGRPAAGQTRRGRGRMAGLDLSDEQEEKINTIRTDFREKIRAAEGREARREIAREMREAIGEVLTDEQKEKMKKLRAERRGRGGNRRRRRRGGEGDGGQE